MAKVAGCMHKRVLLFSLKLDEPAHTKEKAECVQDREPVAYQRSWFDINIRPD